MVAARVREIFDERAKRRQGTRTDIPETLPGSKPVDARDEAGAAFGVSGKQVDKATKVLSQGAKPLDAMAPRRPSPDLLSPYMTVFKKFRICCRTPGSTCPLKTSRK